MLGVVEEEEFVSIRASGTLHSRVYDRFVLPFEQIAEREPARLLCRSILRRISPRGISAGCGAI